MKKWRKISSKIVHTNPWYSVRKDKVLKPNGEKGTYHVVVRKPTVFIVPIDDSGNVTLIGKHQYATSMYSLEIPAGGSDGQKPLTAAKRELKEEAGIIAKKWTLLSKFQVINGFSNEIGYVYLAQDLTASGGNQKSMEEEGIFRIINIPLSKALDMIKKGKITDGQTIVALSLASLNL